TNPYLGRLAPRTLRTIHAVDSSATSFLVASAPPYTTTAAHFPHLWRINGEDVVAVSMSLVTPSFGGVGTAPHADTRPVTPGFPSGSPVAGDLLLILAAIRNSPTGNPNAPAGYTQIAKYSNFRLFAKYATGSDAAPTVTFDDGVAGATSSAQM